MVPFAENLDFWLLMALAAGFIWFVARRRSRAVVPGAPPVAFRSPAQVTMYRASIVPLIVPVGYVLGVDGTHFWPVVVVVGVQSFIQIALVGAKVGYRVRVVLIPLIALVSIAGGAVSSVWPAVDASSLQAAPWMLLSATAVAFAVGAVLSIYSWPVGLGERAH
jgi:Na+/H+-dicarboxylate symporter